MAVYGDLVTMPLPELLQWLGGSAKTGVLEVERDKVCKVVTFQAGRVVESSSNDPRELFGHFLVSRGQITEDLLRIALAQQETNGKPLGTVLVEMGVLSSEDLLRNLAAKAEETLFSLFDWNDAIFRYREDREIPEPLFAVDIRVEDILLRGMQRLDELRQIRAVFDDPGIVTERTEKLPPPEVFRNKMARRIYESINGERTVADIVLHAHGSEYLVTKFLFELHRTGLIKILEVRRAPERPVAPPPPVAGDQPVHEDTAAPAANPAATTGETATAKPAESERPEESHPNVPAPAGHRPEVEHDLERASRLLSKGDFDGALQVLDPLYATHPENESLRRLTSEAEAAFVEKAYKHYLPAEKIPVLVEPLESLEAVDLTPQEYFMLSRIDGTWNLKAVIQIAPIREVEALRTLKRMREAGIIDLQDPD
jgi:hypothetical protein